MKKKRLSSKGQASMSFLVKTVLVLVGFMLIGGLIARTVSRADDNALERICRQSVDLRTSTAANIDSADLKEIKFSTLLCKTIDVKLSGTKEEIQEELAQMMARCWWMFQEGRTNDLFQTVPGLGGANKGFVCYTALIDEIEDSESGKISINEFTDYLAEENSYPGFNDGDGSYLSYIQYGGGPGRVMFHVANDAEFSDGYIGQGHGYEIAFIEKSGDNNQWIGPTLGVGGIATTAAGVGLAFVSGGFSLIVTSAALIGGGAIATVVGGEITLDEYLSKENDVSTVLLLDFADKQAREKFHQEVFIGDIAGD